MLGWTRARLAWMDGNLDSIHAAAGGRGVACACDAGLPLAVAACLRECVCPYPLPPTPSCTTMPTIIVMTHLGNPEVALI